jgi:hypothetical protein
VLGAGGVLLDVAANYPTITDSLFAGDTGISTLSIANSGAEFQVTAGANAQAAGIHYFTVGNSYSDVQHLAFGTLSAAGYTDPVTIDFGQKSGWFESLQGGSGADSIVAGGSSAWDTLQGFVTSTANSSNDTLTGGDNTCADLFVLGDADGNAYGNGLGGVAYINHFNSYGKLSLHNENDYTFQSGSFGVGGAYNTELLAGSNVVAYIDDQSHGLASSSSMSHVNLIGLPPT